MINDEDDRGRDRQSSDDSQPSKRKRISSGNKPYERVSYRPSPDESNEQRPLYSSDRSSDRPSRGDSGNYHRENYRRSPDDYNRNDRRERNDRGPGYDRNSGYERRSDRSGYDRGNSGYDRGNSGYDRGNSGYERGNSGYDRGNSGYDRGNSGYERRSDRSGYDRGNSGYDRGNSGYDRGNSGYERGSGYDRGNSGYDRNQGRSYDRGNSGYDSRGGYKKSFHKGGKPGYQNSQGRFGNKPRGLPRPVEPPPPQPTYKVDALPPDVPIRLNKYIANTGVCSRREADEYIQAGLIMVNGKLVTELGSKVLPTDEIRYNGERLQPEKKVYILLNKPKDYVTSVDDPHAKRTVMELLKGACRERIYPVGRLDRMTTGVLLLTNDGELTKKLTHPTSNIRKIYQVHLDKALKGDDFNGIAEGITLDDGFIKMDGISYISDDDRSTVGVEIHSGRNRIVRRVFEHFGYKVTKLDRVYFAGLTKKSLQRGRWRYLDPKEVGFLKMMRT